MSVERAYVSTVRRGKGFAVVVHVTQGVALGKYDEIDRLGTAFLALGEALAHRGVAVDSWYAAKMGTAISVRGGLVAPFVVEWGA